MFNKYNFKAFIILTLFGINFVSCGGGNDATVANPSNNDNPNIAPGLPKNVSAIAGDGFVTVKWQVPSTGGKPSYYKIDKSIDNKKTFTSVNLNVSSDVLIVIDPDAIYDKEHIYRIFSGNSIGVSDAVYTNPVIPQKVAQTNLKFSSLLTSPFANKKNRLATSFGKSIALSPDGNLMAIAERVINPAVISETEVQLYGKIKTGWKNLGLIVSQFGNEIDAFGTSVLFSPDSSVLAISEFNIKQDYPTDMGSIQLFNVSNTGSWSLIQVLTAKAFERGKKFGAAFSFSPDGTTLAVSEYSIEQVSTTNIGTVYLYNKSETGWELSQTLSSSVSKVDHYFGHSIAFSPDGSILAIGEPRGQSDNAGSVQLFLKSNFNWKHVHTLESVTPAISSQFGISVAFSADNKTLAVGETKTVVNQSASTVQLFTKDGNVWSRSQILSPEQSSETGFGMSLTFNPVSNSLVISGVPNQMNYQGKAYWFNYLDSSWSQSQILKSQNSLLNDQFGVSVIFSSDGSTLIIGETRGNLDGNTGNVGVVNIFKYN